MSLEPKSFLEKWIDPEHIKLASKITGFTEVYVRKVRDNERSNNDILAALLKIANQNERDSKSVSSNLNK